MFEFLMALETKQIFPLKASEFSSFSEIAFLAIDNPNRGAPFQMN